MIMVKESDRIKMAVIAGAAHALKMRNNERFATDADIIQKVAKELDVILENIDLEK